MEFELDEIQKVTLGGVCQKIHILGCRRQNPVLLFLHGGPGVSNRDTVMRRLTGLCDAFTLVAWDQRGTGGSYWGVKPNTLHVDQLVADAAELVQYLCGQLGKQKLFLWGGSWGTELGTYLCSRHPQHIAAYVGSGQVVNGIQGEQLSYEFALQKAAQASDRRALATLAKIGPPQNGCYREIFKGLMAQRRIMKQYGGHTVKQGTYWRDTAKPLLQSHEFSFTDKLGLVLGYRRCLTLMWPSVVQCDFPRQCTHFEMPYYIFQGRLDNNTPSGLIEGYYQQFEAPDKDLVWFEHSAHGPLTEEPQRYKQLLREYLLQRVPGITGSDGL